MTRLQSCNFLGVTSTYWDEQCYHLKHCSVAYNYQIIFLFLNQSKRWHRSAVA